MTTTNGSTTITWETQDETLLYGDFDERMEVYLAMGEDEQGNQYTSEAYYFNGWFNEIQNIERV